MPNAETYEDLERRVHFALAAKELAQMQYGRAKAKYDRAYERQRDIDAVQALLQSVATTIQQKLGFYIGSVVTEALHTVFPERQHTMFVVSFRENRGRTECQLLLVDGDAGKAGESGAHPYDCAGGGVWDVLSFALRCTVLVMEQPAPARTLVLDEPFKFLHGVEPRKRALAMALNTFRKLGIQAVIVHQSESGDNSELASIAENDASNDVRIYNVEKTGSETSKVSEL